MGGKIVFMGKTLPREYNAAPRVQLGEKALLPAFGDTHIHFLSYAFFSAGLDVRAAITIADTQAAIADFVRERSSSFVVDFGASVHSVREKRLLTREDIDTVCSDCPAFIAKYDDHAAVANSALIAQVAGKLGNLRGFDARSGLMTQEAFFRVTDVVTGKISLPATLGNMLADIDALADFSREDYRHTVIHACLPTGRGLATCAKLGISIAV
jgi:predicted amidohydrolase YtcJ